MFSGRSRLRRSLDQARGPGLIQRDVVDDHPAGERLQHFLPRPLVVGVAFEFRQGVAVSEAHEKREIEGVVHDGTVTRHGLSVAEGTDEAGGFPEFRGGADQRGAVFGLAGAFEPDEDGMLDPAVRSGGASRAEEAKQQCGEPAHRPDFKGWQRSSQGWRMALFWL